MGKALRSLRKREGLTQAVLGKKTKLGPTHISFLETGKLSPNYTTLVRLSIGLVIELTEWIAVAEEIDRELGAT
jgi:transcriptional regulator with XRE-family HTH domain